MEIRQADVDDIPELLRMGEAFHSVSGYGDFCDFGKDEAEITIRTLIEHETLIMCEGGMLGFVIFPIFMAKNVSMAQEVFWWVDESKRGSGIAITLLKRAEAIAKNRGAKVFTMLCLNDLNGDKVGKMYSRLGYQPKEKNYMRVL